MSNRKDLCPCGCGTDVPTPDGFGTRPFVSVDGLKVFLATYECIERHPQTDQKNTVVPLKKE